MTPAIAALVFGAIIAVAGWQNRNVIDVALGREGKMKDASPADAARKFLEDNGTSSLGLLSDTPYPQGDGSNAPTGTKMMDGKPVAAWIYTILRWAKNHGWSGTVTSGYRSYAEQKAIWDSGVRPAARPGFSNHEGKNWPRGAVDVSNADDLERVLKKYPGVLKIRRDPSINDPVHFSFTGR